MAAGYSGIRWDRQKVVYDAVLALLVLVLVGGFATVSLRAHPGITGETVLIRSTALAGFALLHGILCIGPLARLDRRFLPWLYNRRHAGVATFALAAVHAVLAVFQFHALGLANPLVSLFAAYPDSYLPLPGRGLRPSDFPFEPFGAAALAILFLMAATSHDFWLRNLGARFWKSMHLMVLPAYGLLVLHVAYGALQSERAAGYVWLLAAGASTVFGLHLAAALREKRRDRGEVGTEAANPEDIDVGPLAGLREGRGRSVRVGILDVAVFLHQGHVYAVSGACRHQGGPLGEGRVVAGCITCPWHGWQYRPEDGCSPPPFEEQLATHRVTVRGGRVWVDPRPAPPGTRQPGAPAASGSGNEPPGPAGESGEFYVGYHGTAPPGVARFTRLALIPVVLGAALLAAAAARWQAPLRSGHHEFGVRRTFEGVLYTSPVPFVRLTQRGDARSPGFTNVLLAGSGKRGLPAAARDADGEKVRFRGTLVHAGGTTMIELPDPLDLERLGTPLATERRGEREPISDVTLTGELVDTKCYLGVMRPATGKVHRACAVNCLAGGVPPALLIRRAEGGPLLVLLAGEGDGALDFDPADAGLRMTAEGTLELHGDLPVLRARALHRSRGSG